MTQELIYLFAPRIQEQVINRAVKYGQQTTEYIYRTPREEKLTKIQKYFYLHPHEYANIVEYALAYDEDTGKRYKLKDVAEMMQALTGASIVSCSNEIKKIRAQYEE